MLLEESSLNMTSKIDWAVTGESGDWGRERKKRERRKEANRAKRAH